MRHERRGLRLPGGAREFLVAEGGYRLLVEHHVAVRAEVTQAGAVRVAVALDLQRVRGIQQPERRPDPGRARGETEQTAHDVEPIAASPGGHAPVPAG